MNVGRLSFIDQYVCLICSMHGNSKLKQMDEKGGLKELFCQVKQQLFDLLQ